MFIANDLRSCTNTTPTCGARSLAARLTPSQPGDASILKHSTQRYVRSELSSNGLFDRFINGTYVSVVDMKRQCTLHSSGERSLQLVELLQCPLTLSGYEWTLSDPENGDRHDKPLPAFCQYATETSPPRPALFCNLACSSGTRSLESSACIQRGGVAQPHDEISIATVTGLEEGDSVVWDSKCGRCGARGGELPSRWFCAHMTTITPYDALDWAATHRYISGDQTSQYTCNLIARFCDSVRL